MQLGKKSGQNTLYQELIADGEVQRVALDLVDRDENQPRSIEEVKAAAKDLQSSIAINGIVQMPVYRTKEDGRFSIVVGECRTEGARLNGDETIVAVIKSFENSKDAKKQISEIRYAENDPKTRKNLTPLDEAKFWADYIGEFYTDEKGMAQVKKAAQYLNQDQSKISQFLGIDKASDKIKTLIKKHHVTDYQLAYIMARMEKHKGLIDSFINKIESVDMKGGIQSLANKMLKEAKNKEHDEKQQSKTLDLPPQTAAQAEADRQKKLKESAAEEELKNEFNKIDRETKEEGYKDKKEQQDNENKEDLTVENNEEKEIEKTEEQEQQENDKPVLPANIGTIRLNITKNTVIVSTIANQPATLTKDQALALINELQNWINKSG